MFHIFHLRDVASLIFFFHTGKYSNVRTVWGKKDMDRYLLAEEEFGFNLLYLLVSKHDGVSLQCYAPIA